MTRRKGAKGQLNHDVCQSVGLVAKRFLPRHRHCHATPSRQSVKEMLLARSDGKTRKEGEESRSVGSDTSSHCLNSTSRKYLRQVMRGRPPRPLLAEPSYLCMADIHSNVSLRSDSKARTDGRTCNPHAARPRCHHRAREAKFPNLCGRPVCVQLQSRSPSSLSIPTLDLLQSQICR